MTNATNNRAVALQASRKIHSSTILVYVCPLNLTNSNSVLKKVTNLILSILVLDLVKLQLNLYANVKIFLLNSLSDLLYFLF